LWGWIQQLLVLGIFVGNLEAIGVRRPALIALAGIGFAAVHLPDWPLCGATLLLGLGCSALFLRHRNLWPLGVLHGWLGACFYRWVLARDPWADVLTVLGR
jgi:ABC-type cobalamin transport system permease subunit